MSVAAPLGIQRHLEHSFPLLMSHYVAVTSVTLPFLSDGEWFWQSALPYQAEGNAYLRHSLLALSALHISHLGPDNPREYFVAACAHQSRASCLFREVVLEVNEHNCFEVFAFIVIVAIFHFYVSLRAGTSVRPNEPFNAFEVLFALRGGMQLASAQIVGLLIRSPLGALVGRLWDQTQFVMDEDMRQALAGLDMIDRVLNSPDQAHESCSQAAAFLRLWLFKFSTRPIGWLHIGSWPFLVPPDYLIALSERRPAALAIFVYWCAAMSNAPRRWFLDGWAERAADSAIEFLGAEWDDVLKWPRGVMQSKLNPFRPQQLKRATVTGSAFSGSAGQPRQHLPLAGDPVCF